MRLGQLGFGVGLSLAALSGAAHGAIQFNEIMYDAPGANPTKRFFEVRSTTGGAESLADVSLIAIEGDGTTIKGLVDFATSFGNVSTGSNGLALIRDGAVVLEPAPDPATTVVVDAYTYNENTSVTYLLVSGFTGTVGTTDIDSDDDGTADGTFPWTAVLDAVAFRDAATDTLYAAQLGGVDYNEADAPYSGADIFGFLRDDSGNRHTFRAAGDVDGPYTVDISPTLPVGYTLTPGSANNPVPEPTSLGLALAGGMLLLRRTRGSR
jgi:hypothetical protein